MECQRHADGRRSSQRCPTSRGTRGRCVHLRRPNVAVSKCRPGLTVAPLSYLTRLVVSPPTHHSRACPELNESDGDRCAILNSVLPAWIQPMSPLQEGAQQPMHAAKKRTASHRSSSLLRSGRRGRISKLRCARRSNTPRGPGRREDVWYQFLCKITARGSRALIGLGPRTITFQSLISERYRGR